MRDVREGVRVRGRVILTAYRPGTREVVVRIEALNLITNVGLNLLAQMLGEQSGYDTGITYCAIGTDNTAPAAGDTTLTTESARKTITSYSISGGELTCSTFFLSTECNVAIEEVGAFGHSTAGAGADSGVMVNHALLSYDNSGGSPNDITVDIVITFS